MRLVEGQDPYNITLAKFIDDQLRNIDSVRGRKRTLAID